MLQTWVQDMTASDRDPPAAKRRKTNSHDTSNLPLPSRAFRAVKEAVFGRSSLRSSPGSRQPSGSTGQAAPVASTKSINNDEEEIVDWDVPDSGDEGTGRSVRVATHTSETRGTSVEQSNGTKPTPSKRSNGRGGKTNIQRDQLDSYTDGPRILITPKETGGSDYKLRSASRDRDELGEIPIQEEAAEISKGIRSDASQIRKAYRKDQLQPDKPGVRSKLRGDATLGYFNGRGDLLASVDNIAGQLDRSSAGGLDHLESAHSSRKLRQKPRMHSIEPNEFVKVTQTPPSRSGRKRGPQEVTRIDNAAIDGTPSNPSGRKRGRPRKQDRTTVLQIGQDDDFGFRDIPSRVGLINALLGQTSRDDNITAIEGTCPSATSLATLRKTSTRLTEATVKTKIAPERISSKDVVEGVPEIGIEDPRKGYAKELRSILENDTTGLLTSLKLQIMDGLTGKRRLGLVNLEEEYQKVHHLLEQTVLAGEGNSMLVIGSRGTAKTVLVETVIGELAIDHRDEFHVVRLNGFIHTDDKLALREIWRQLGREMEVEDDAMGGRSNYADTLTSLLALLSHSAETPEGERDHIAKSVIFVIDEFDLFASHPRQTLLYNLFDVAQSRNAPIAVLGLTTKVDVVESLEKRVKSRFSQRYVHLSLPKSYAAFQDICKSALVCQNPTMSTRLNHEDANFQTMHTAWTNYVNEIFTDDPAFNAFLLRIYTRLKSVPSFLTASLLPISLLSPTHIPTGLDFATQTLSPPDSKLHLLPGLSDLELSLLIAAARLDIILDTDLCNFTMAYDEYQRIASRVKAQSSAAGQTAVGGGARVWGREVASGAWERLAELELILPATGGSGKGEMGRANGRMWRVDVGLEEIGPSVGGISGVMLKWCREI